MDKEVEKELLKSEIFHLIGAMFVVATFLVILKWGIKTNHRLDALESAIVQPTEYVSSGTNEVFVVNMEEN